MKAAEKEWQKVPGSERIERMLCKACKVVYREMQIVLLDQMIQMGKNSVDFFDTTAEHLM